MRAVITDAALLVGGSFAASLIAKATLVLGVALVARWLTRRNRAAVRHVVLSAAFVVLLALPVAGLIPSRAIELGPAEPPVTSAAVVLMVPDVPPATAAAPASLSPANSRRNISIETVLACAWAVGVLALLIPMLAGMWHMRSLRRSASPSSRARALATRLLEDAGIRRQVDVLQHDAVSGPMTWGVVRPTILLPGDVSAWRRRRWPSMSHR